LLLPDRNCSIETSLATINTN